MGNNYSSQQNMFMNHKSSYSHNALMSHKFSNLQNVYMNYKNSASRNVLMSYKYFVTQNMLIGDIYSDTQISTLWKRKIQNQASVAGTNQLKMYRSQIDINHIRKLKECFESSKENQIVRRKKYLNQVLEEIGISQRGYLKKNIKNGGNANVLWVKNRDFNKVLEKEIKLFDICLKISSIKLLKSIENAFRNNVELSNAWLIKKSFDDSRSFIGSKLSSLWERIRNFNQVQEERLRLYKTSTRIVDISLLQNNCINLLQVRARLIAQKHIRCLEETQNIGEIRSKYQKESSSSIRTEVIINAQKQKSRYLKGNFFNRKGIKVRGKNRVSIDEKFKLIQEDSLLLEGKRSLYKLLFKEQRKYIKDTYKSLEESLSEVRKRRSNAVQQQRINSFETNGGVADLDKRSGSYVWKNSKSINNKNLSEIQDYLHHSENIHQKTVLEFKRHTDAKNNQIPIKDGQGQNTEVSDYDLRQNNKLTMSQGQIDDLVEQIYWKLEKKLKFERQRSGT